MDFVGGRNGYFFDSTNLENENQIEELHDESNTGDMPSGKTSKADFEDDHEKFKGTYVQA